MRGRRRRIAGMTAFRCAVGALAVGALAVAAGPSWVASLGFAARPNSSSRGSAE